MYEVLAKKTMYNGKSRDTSTHCAMFLKTMELPFTPYCRLQVADGSFLEKIETVLWDSQNNRFVITCEDGFVEARSLSDFDKALTFDLENLGWDEKRKTISVY